MKIERKEITVAELTKGYQDKTDANGEVREFTEDDFKNAVPLSALPESLQVILRDDKKTAQVTIDSDVLDTFRAIGIDWQANINTILRDWLKEHAA